MHESPAEAPQLDVVVEVVYFLQTAFEFVFATDISVVCVNTIVVKVKTRISDGKIFMQS